MEKKTTLYIVDHPSALRVAFNLSMTKPNHLDQVTSSFLSQSYSKQLKGKAYGSLRCAPMSHNVEPSAKGGLSWKVDFVNPNLWVPTHKRCGDAQSALRRSLYKMANPGRARPQYSNKPLQVWTSAFGEAGPYICVKGCCVCWARPGR